MFSSYSNKFNEQISFDCHLFTRTFAISENFCSDAAIFLLIMHLALLPRVYSPRFSARLDSYRLLQSSSPIIPVIPIIRRNTLVTAVVVYSPTASFSGEGKLPRQQPRAFNHAVRLKPMSLMASPILAISAPQTRPLHRGSIVTPSKRLQTTHARRIF